jgi:hypothetical protein
LTTRDIRTSTPITVCDVCGRTLLRGEREHIYLDGSARRSVCELCTARALHEGWVREGSMPDYESGRGASDRRRSLFHRLRGRRDPAPEPEYEPDARPSRLSRLRGREGALPDDGEPAAWDGHEPAPVAAPSPRRRPRESAREPRHVRAIPTSDEQKFAAAIDYFNASEHRRTVAGVARSLGMPTVAVLPAQGSPGLVAVVVSWELCWYRYEIDLSEDAPGVRVVSQGYELDELDEAQRRANAVADEHGALSLAV